jgi:hypothetical protein
MYEVPKAQTFRAGEKVFNGFLKMFFFTNRHEEIYHPNLTQANFDVFALDFYRKMAAVFFSFLLLLS